MDSFRGFIRNFTRCQQRCICSETINHSQYTQKLHKKIEAKERKSVYLSLHKHKDGYG